MKKADYRCCIYQDQLREAKKKMGKENIQKAVKTAIDAAHADVGLDTTAVREAVVKAMNRFKVGTPIHFCQVVSPSSKNHCRFSIISNLLQQFIYLKKK